MWLVVFICMLQQHSPSRASAHDTFRMMREADALFAHEKDVGKVNAAIELYKNAATSEANNYEAHWKLARAYYSLVNRIAGSEETKEYRKRISREGMHCAQRALEANPSGLEGHYYYALCLTQRMIAIGGFNTLVQGLDREYAEHMNKAFAIDKYYDTAGPLKGLGRYFYYLPWPRKDLKKSIAYLEEAVAFAPHNIRARVYLAESYLKAGKRDLALACLRKALQVVPDERGEIDALRWKNEAEQLLHSLDGMG
jgi:tetratricopeptide (TPR) repeat protein